MFINCLDIISVIQIITESLPVSSSGHILLLEIIFEKLNSIVCLVPKYFDHFLHGPAIFIIAATFFDQWRQPFIIFFKSVFLKKSLQQWKIKAIHKIILKLFWFGLIADGIVAISYLFNDLIIQQLNIRINPFCLGIGFIFTAIILFSTKFYSKVTFSFELLTTKKALIVGVAQSLALFPGISRFAITYATLLLLNISPKRSFEISFLFEFPICIAAFLKGLYKINFLLSADSIFTFGFFILIFLSTICSFWIFCKMYSLAKKNYLWPIAFYMPLPILISFIVQLLF